MCGNLGKYYKIGHHFKQLIKKKWCCLHGIEFMDWIRLLYAIKELVLRGGDAAGGDGGDGAGVDAGDDGTGIFL
ncbi:hypothetical protein QE152_g36172 [Popillia japonica]|uniref:Uncharacterized protein n=1 Tax=Popillia japonica TaxID=7064 RepID=A0AAW1IDS2_POPJA